MATTNGSTLSEKTKLPLSLVIVLAGLLLAGAGSYWAVANSLGTHVANCDIHHSTQTLDQTYMRKDLSDQRYQQLIQSLSEIKADQKDTQAMLRQLGATQPRGQNP